MKTLYKNSFFLLIVLLFVPTAMWAQGENVVMTSTVTNDDNSWNTNTFTVTTTAYMNGASTSVTRYQPTEMVLILDASNEMTSGSARYENAGTDFNQLDKVNGANEGYYVASFTFTFNYLLSARTRSIERATLRYYNNNWQCYFNNSSDIFIQNTDWHNVNSANISDVKIERKIYDYSLAPVAGALINAASSMSQDIDEDISISVIKFADTAEQLCGFTSVGTPEGVNTLTNAISTIQPVGNCKPDNAFAIVENNVQYSSDVLKVVVFITSGNYQNRNDGAGLYDYFTVSAGNAINISKRLKEDKGIKVFSIGFSTPNNSTSAFLENLSSNYPHAYTQRAALDATTMTLQTTTRESQDYYTRTTNVNDLSNIISTMTEKGSTEVIQVTSFANAKLNLVLSDDFKLADSNITIQLQQNGYYWSGLGYSSGDINDPITLLDGSSWPNVKWSVNGKSLTVEGFDFGTNYVPTNNTADHRTGYKLIVTYKVMIEPQCEGGLKKYICSPNADSGLLLDPEDPVTFFVPMTESNVAYLDLPNIEIVKSGLKKGESVLFEVRQQTNRNNQPASFNSNPIMVWITGDDDESQPDKAIVKFQQPTFTYTSNYRTQTANMNYQVKQLTWDWAYSTSSTTPAQSSNNPWTVNQALGVTAEKKTFTFTSSPANGKPTHAEHHTVNQKKQ